MTPVFQNIKHDPLNGLWGNCHQAALASILDLPLEAVPHIAHEATDGDIIWEREREFLKTQGLIPVHTAWEDDLKRVFKCLKAFNPGVYYLLSGTSKNGTGHIVVALDDRIVHDPSPESFGIVGPMEGGMYFVTYLASLRTSVYSPDRGAQGVSREDKGTPGR